MKDFVIMTRMSQLKKKLRTTNEMRLHMTGMSPVQVSSVNELRNEMYLSAEEMLDDIIEKLETTHIVKKRL